MFDIIKNNPEKSWKLYENPNITVQIVEDNLDKINWYYLSDNKFILENHKINTLKNTRKIKEELLNKSWHPDRIMDWCLDEEHKKSILEKFDK